MALVALIIKTRLSLTDDKLVERIKEKSYPQFFMDLEAFQYSAPFDPSMMLCYRKRLPKSIVTDTNETTVRHSLSIIRSAESEHDEHVNRDSGVPSSDQPAQTGSDKAFSNQRTVLIDAMWVPVDIRYPTDHSLLNEAREVTEKLIAAMHPQIRASFGDKPRTHRMKARQQYLSVAKKKQPRIAKIRKAIRQQLGHLERNLTSIDALIACGGFLLAAVRHLSHKLLVVSELLRQQTILYHSDSRSIPDRIVSLFQAHIRFIVRGKATSNVEFGAKVFISDTGDVYTLLDWLSHNPL